MMIHPDRNQLSRLIAVEMRYFNRQSSKKWLTFFTWIIALIGALLTVIRYYSGDDPTDFYLRVSAALLLFLLLLSMINRLFSLRNTTFSRFMFFTSLTYLAAAFGGLIITRVMWSAAFDRSMIGGIDVYYDNLIRWIFWFPGGLLVLFLLLMFTPSKRSYADGGYWYLLFIFSPLFILALTVGLLKLELPREIFLQSASISASVWLSYMLALFVNYFIKSVFHVILRGMPVYDDSVVVKRSVAARDGRAVQWRESRPEPQVAAPVASSIVGWSKNLFSSNNRDDLRPTATIGRKSSLAPVAPPLPAAVAAVPVEAPEKFDSVSEILRIIGENNDSGSDSQRSDLHKTDAILNAMPPIMQPSAPSVPVAVAPQVAVHAMTPPAQIKPELLKEQPATEDKASEILKIIGDKDFDTTVISWQNIPQSSPKPPEDISSPAQQYIMQPDDFADIMMPDTPHAVKQTVQPVQAEADKEIGAQEELPFANIILADEFENIMLPIQPRAIESPDNQPITAQGKVEEKLAADSVSLKEMVQDVELVEIEPKPQPNDSPDFSLDTIAQEIAEPVASVSVPESGAAQQSSELFEQISEEQVSGQLAEQPEQKPEEQVSGQLAEQPEQKPEEQVSGQLVEQPEQKPEEQVSGQLAEQPEQKPEEQVSEQLAEQPEQKPEEQVSGQLAEQPEQKPEDQVSEQQEDVEQSEIHIEDVQTRQLDIIDLDDLDDLMDLGQIAFADARVGQDNKLARTVLSRQDIVGEMITISPVSMSGSLDRVRLKEMEGIHVSSLVLTEDVAGSFNELQDPDMTSIIEPPIGFEYNPPSEPPVPAADEYRNHESNDYSSRNEPEVKIDSAVASSDNTNNQSDTLRYPEGYCGKCGKKLATGLRFCTKCGTKRRPVDSDNTDVRQYKGFCVSCGQPMIEGSNFCNKCGISFDTIRGDNSEASQ